MRLEFLRIEERDDRTKIWDPIRKKWIILTPEELVRQKLVKFLVEEKGISAALISVEKEIPYFSLKKRFDVVVFDRQARPFILCECKAPEVPITNQTLQQISRYNSTLKAPHLLLTNGEMFLFFSLNKKEAYDFQKSGWLEE